MPWLRVDLERQQLANLDTAAHHKRAFQLDPVVRGTLDPERHIRHQERISLTALRRLSSHLSAERGVVIAHPKRLSVDHLAVPEFVLEQRTDKRTEQEHGKRLHVILSTLLGTPCTIAVVTG